LEKVQESALWLLDKYPNLDNLPILKNKIFKQEKDVLV
jgi:hypothetical protein